MSVYPFCDGYCAALRVDVYEGCTTVPENPYEEGTEQYQEWEEGFAEGMDWLCVNNQFLED